MKTRWYFVSLVYRFRPENQDELRPAQRCLANENWHIINAANLGTARRKAKSLATELCSILMKDEDSGREGHWALVGIKDIWPIDDAIEDGAEIGWFKHLNIPYQHLLSMVDSQSRSQSSQRSKRHTSRQPRATVTPSASSSARKTRSGR